MSLFGLKGKIVKSFMDPETRILITTIRETKVRRA
jgi:hypothetical protein